jgi:hypothetical protein
LFSIIFLFRIVRKYCGRKEAILSAFLFTVLPYNIYYTRVILPEPFLVFTSLGMLYFTDKLFEVAGKGDGKLSLRLFKYSVLSIIFTAFSILVKPYAVFLLIPVLYLWIRNFRMKVTTIILLITFLAIVLTPFLLWRIWIQNFPEGIPAYSWLLNGDGIRFKGAFFYWIFADRLSRLILGYWGLPLFLMGILAPLKKEGYFFRIWGITIRLFQYP